MSHRRFEDYITKAEENLTFSQSCTDDCWKITAMFYTSLHYMCAWLKQDFEKFTVASHYDIKTLLSKTPALKEKLGDEMYANYDRLNTLSRIARYMSAGGCNSQKWIKPKHVTEANQLLLEFKNHFESTLARSVEV